MRVVKGFKEEHMSVSIYIVQDDLILSKHSTPSIFAVGGQSLEYFNLAHGFKLLTKGRGFYEILARRCHVMVIRYAARMTGYKPKNRQLVTKLFDVSPQRAGVTI